MKTGELLLLGLLGAAAYYLVKTGALDDIFNFGGGGGGGLETVLPIGGELPPGGITKTITYSTSSPVISPLVPPILGAGAVVQQMPSPGISYNSPANTVIVGPNVPSGGITVIPAYHPTPSSRAPLIQQPQAPLKIVNVFGFPVVPKLSATVPKEPIVRGKGAYNKPGGM